MKYWPTLLLLLSTNSMSATLVVGSDLWCPYYCDNESGYVVELTRSALNIQGHKVVFVTLPFKRALIEAQQNKIDAVLNVSEEAVLKYQLVSGDVVIGYESKDFYTSITSDHQFYDIDDLEKVDQIGVITGYHYGNELNEWLANNPNTYFAAGDNPLADNIMRLVKKRHSAIIDNRIVIDYTASLLNLQQQIRYAGTIGEVEPLFVGFSQNKKQFSTILKQGIEQLKANGEYQAILDKYDISFASEVLKSAASSKTELEPLLEVEN